MAACARLVRQAGQLLGRLHFRQPVRVYGASTEQLATVHARALSRGPDVAVYIEEMFKKGNDDDSRAAVRAVAGDALPLVALVLYGARTRWTRYSKASRCTPNSAR